MAFPRPAALAVLALAASACLSAPDLDERLAAAGPLDETTEILASDGSVLASLHAEIDRQSISLDEVPRVVRDAVIAVEDRRFYSHKGVDAPALARALARNVAAGDVVEGGSTITQQLAKSILENSERTWKRKVREAVLARSLEERFTKDEILERYLNTVYFGRGAYGIQAASRTFFGRAVSDLEVHEAAMLAGMIRAPSRTDPTREPERARERRTHALRAMRETGRISAAVEARAASTPLGAIAPSAAKHRAPHLISHVIDQIGDGAHGLEVLGATRADRERRLYRGGLRITTTLDPRMQASAEASVAAILHRSGDPQAALVALDPSNGHIKAMVGGRSADDPEVGAFNLATQARRQPGSVFKPFTLVAALENGIDLSRRYAAPARMRLRVPGGSWSVGNYDGGSFGRISLREATANSVNTVYAQVALEVGPERVAEVARRMGISTEMSAYPSIALGAQEVTPLELARSYATLAAGGVRRPALAVTKVATADGEVLYEAPAEEVKALAPATAARATDALRSVVDSGTATRLDPGFPVAAKTGTTDDHRDAWFAGYSPRLVAVTWVGFARATLPMIPPRTRIRVYGGAWPGQIWSRFMREAHRGLPAARFSGANEDVVVPDVAGMTFEDARKILVTAGLSVRSIPRYCPSARPGTVCDQSPRPGLKTRPGTEVGLAIADDSAIAVVDSVLGMRVGAAKRALAGFEVVVEERAMSESFTGCRDPSVTGSGRVWAQEPCAGADFGAGSAVLLLVNP